jgi:hypothetical protein
VNSELQIRIQQAVFRIQIQCIFYPWILDGKNPDPGSAINIPHHIFKSLITIIGVISTNFFPYEKNLKFFVEDLGSGTWTLDPGSEMKKSGCGKNILDPQHCQQAY